MKQSFSPVVVRGAIELNFDESEYVPRTCWAHGKNPDEGALSHGDAAKGNLNPADPGGRGCMAHVLAARIIAYWITLTWGHSTGEVFPRCGILGVFPWRSSGKTLVERKGFCLSDCSLPLVVLPNSQSIRPIFGAHRGLSDTTSRQVTAEADQSLRTLLQSLLYLSCNSEGHPQPGQWGVCSTHRVDALE